MTLIDTSAWVEYLRDTGSDACERAEVLLRRGAGATTDIVMLEVLAGARDELHLRRLGGLLARCRYIGTAPGDYLEAAAVYRTCRRRGTTPRVMADCLVVAVALRSGEPLLHTDRDFVEIARHVPLRLDS